MIILIRCGLFILVVLSQVSLGNSACTDLESERLRQADYNSCEISNICNGNARYQESLITAKVIDLTEIKNKMLSLGCSHVVFVNDNSRTAQSNGFMPYRIFSRNCALVDFGTECPDGYQLSVGARNHVLNHYALCTPNQKASKILPNAVN